LIAQGRVDFSIMADYSENSEMEEIIFAILDQVKAVNKIIELHVEYISIN
jgi:hypothetical protein